MKIPFVEVISDDPMDRKGLVPLSAIAYIETNADGDDRVHGVTGNVYIPKNSGNVYESFVVINVTTHEEVEAYEGIDRL